VANQRRTSRRPGFGVPGAVDSASFAADVFDMNLDLIRKKLSGGFQPFVIRTSDGREFKVPHPEFIMVGKYAVAVVDADGDIDTIAALHIASIKDLTGRRGGRRAA
jgi:hypothetical protein